MYKNISLPQSNCQFRVPVRKKAKIIMPRYVVSTIFFIKLLKSHTCSVIGSSERDCVLIILFELYGSKAGLFESNLFWVGHYDPLSTFILEELIQY